MKTQPQLFIDGLTRLDANPDTLRAVRSHLRGRGEMMRDLPVEELGEFVGRDAAAEMLSGHDHDFSEI